MKKTLVVFLCAVLIFMSLPAALPAVVYAAADGPEDWGGYESTVVSKYGEFEGVTEDSLTSGGWTLPEGSLVTGASDAYAGTGYIKLAMGGGALGFSVDAEADSAYLLQGYYKYGTDANAGNAQLFMQEDDVNRYTNYNSALVYTNTWTRFGMAMIANKTKTGEISFAINNPATAASLYLDNVKLIRLDDYDTRNLVQNRSFEFNDVDTTTAQHHYASWFNNGNMTLVSDAHTGDKAMRVNSSNIYTYAFLPEANTEGKRYELSAWVKWENGANFAAGETGYTAPCIGVESYAGNTQLQAKNYYFTVENGIESSDWCHVRLLLDTVATQTTLTHFRLFLFSGTGTTIWDDISIKPAETYMDIVNDKYEVQDSLAIDKIGSYTLRAQYLGAEGEADGKAYFAQYDYDSQGELRLLNVAAGSVKADGRTTECTLEGVDTRGEFTFVRAYLWDEKMNVVDTLEMQEEIPETNIIENGDFENIVNGAPVGITPSHTWGGSNISVVTDEVYSGDYALKLTTTDRDVYFDFNLPDMFYGTTYTLSFMYKGTVTSDVTDGNRENLSGVTAFTRYHADSESPVVYNREFYAPGTYSADDWTEFKYTFRLLEGSELLVRPALRSKNSTIYIDDVTLEVEDGSPVARVVTDRVFYYSDLTGNGEAEIQLSPHFADRGYTADVSLMDGTTVLKSAEGLVFDEENKADFTYDLALLAVKTKEYKVAAVIKDAVGNVVYQSEQLIYKYDRPSTVSKEGTFTDINGKAINPIFAYHIGFDDFETAASAGINVVQYQVNSDVNVTLAELDEMYEMGVYAAIVSYWGMAPAGHTVNYERVSAYIKQIAHHPAIFCYMVMDEPFLNNPEAHEDLRKSYIMLREADPARPTYICEGFPSFMKDVAKYCDIMAPDPYPTGVRGDMATYVTDMVGFADTYVKSDKPLITILQAFTQSGRRPTALELHSMMYQSFLAGSDAPGLYTWVPDDPSLDTKISEGDYWPMLQTFYEEEHEIVYNYYQSHEGELFNYSKNSNDSVWYESWRDGDNIYMVVENRSEDSETTATIPLVSADGKTTISSYDVEPVGYGAVNAIVSDKKAGEFTLKLNACAAALLKIDTTATIDNGSREITVSVEGDFENTLESILTASGWSFPEGSLVTGATDAYSGNGYMGIAAGSKLGFATDNMADSAYLLTGYYKHGTDAETAGSQLFIGEDDADRYLNYNNTLLYTNEWTKFGIALNANKTVTGEISFEIRNTAGATLYLDDVRLVRLDGHDTENMIANSGFEFDDADADTTPQHHYASWFNNGTARLVNTSHTGNRGMMVVTGNIYTHALLPDAIKAGEKYELSAWVKWENGDALVQGQTGLTAPRIGVESWVSGEGSYRHGEDYYFTVDSGITGSDWCKVSVILNDASVTEGINLFRIFLFSGTGETIWDDVSVKAID